MRAFAAEAYVPRPSSDTLGEAARRAQEAAETLTREGTAVRYVGPLLLPGDETCFHVFEAASEAAVAQVVERAGIRVERVVEAALPRREWNLGNERPRAASAKGAGR